MKDTLPLQVGGYMDPSSTVLIREGPPPPTGWGLDGPLLHCLDSCRTPSPYKWGARWTPPPLSLFMKDPLSLQVGG